MTSLVLSQLSVYPVKSLGGVTVDRVEVERQGLAGDRRWMVVDAGGDTVTAREVPRMLGVRVSLEADGLVLAADGLDALRVPEPRGLPTTRVSMNRVGSATPAGAPADAWLTEAIGRDVRLVWLDDPGRRSVSPDHGGAPGDTLSLADAGPVHLTTTASLAQLNTWLADEQDHPPLPMERFRPTVVVDGDLEPFVEDTWAGVRIGDVELRFGERCDRCVMTTVDLDVLRTTKEPTRTLARHRREDGKVWFGIRLIPVTTGSIAVGDEVVALG
ncbi:MOSC domain-containing protein [Cellulomonas composti]|uniref:Molybdenum cofactor biosysynthesis protein n=1 Tax=Cellulomonas composti TaxID=266130 RepID=A0A511J9L7_9CELL|nr:MOSC N-terminal beta barrel domain-containing protein [Cellulomonas composti]GEL94686.1 molybdenum cofactor biosysynthesis protein [Cellulomonas composti]